MAEHVHTYKPGQAVTYTASEDITAGQLVQISGDHTVAPAEADTPSWVGVAGFDAPAGARVLVLSGGVQQLRAEGAIAAGAAVVAAADGAVATSAEPGPGQQVGIAVAAAAESIVEIHFVR